MTTPVPAPDPFAAMRAEADVVRWARLLHAEAVPHVFIKGVGFDRWLGRARVMGDVDLLVPPEARRPVAGMLRREGFRRVLTEPVATTWVSGAERLPVDLHESLKGCGAPPEVVWDAVHAGSIAIDVCGVSVSVLGPPARELLVALHAAFAADGSPAVADLRSAIACCTVDDWRRALVLANELRCRPFFSAGMARVAEGRAVLRDLGVAVRDDLEVALGSTGDVALSLLLAMIQVDRSERLRQLLRFLRVHPIALGSLSAVAAGGPTSAPTVAVLAMQRIARQVASLSRAVPMAARARRTLDPTR